MNQHIVQFVIDKVGCGYIYGAKGQICSPAFRAQQAAQYPEWTDNIIRVGAKWDGKPVWDCAQLTRYAAKAAGYTLPSGATSQWNKAQWARKGEISTIPEGETVFVYREGSGKMQHTGVALGNGECIHAKGTKDGVVRQPMSGYGWTHWATFEQAGNGKEEPMMESKPRKVFAESGSTVMLRPEPSTKSSYLAKVPVGSVVNILSKSIVDGVEWAYVMVDGKSGYMMNEFLVDSGESPAPPAEEALPRSVTVNMSLQAAKDLLRALEFAIGGATSE